MSRLEQRLRGAEDSEVMRFSRYSRLGAWVGVVCLLGVGLAELFRFLGFSSLHFNWGVGTIGAIGLTLLVLQPYRYTRKATPDEILRFYENPHYWGTALLSIALLVNVLGVGVEPEPSPRPIARRQLAPPPEPEEPHVVTFPEFSVSAVVVNGMRSSAVVNGKILWVGESLQGAKLIRVSESDVEFEKEGVSTNVPAVTAQNTFALKPATSMAAAQNK